MVADLDFDPKSSTMVILHLREATEDGGNIQQCKSHSDSVHAVRSLYDRGERTQDILLYEQTVQRSIRLSNGQ